MPRKMWDTSTKAYPMVEESNPIVSRLSVTTVIRETMTMVEGHCELHAEDLDGNYVPCSGPNFHESEHGCLGGSFHTKRCLQKVVA